MGILQKIEAIYDEVEDKHLEESRQIALYDDDVRNYRITLLMVRDEISEVIKSDDELKNRVSLAALVGQINAALAELKGTTDPGGLTLGRNLSNSAVLRTMKDEDLAKFLNNIERQGYEARGHEGTAFSGYGEKNIEFWLKWLKTPEDEDY